MSYPWIPFFWIIPWPGSLNHLSIITLHVNTNTDNFYNASSYIYSLLHPYIVSYIIPSFIKCFLIHPVNRIFDMFTCSSCNMGRVIRNMWVKIHLQISLIAYIVVICIMILTINALYGWSTVRAKWLWLNFHVKLWLQWFSIIRLCNNIIIAILKSFLLNFLHSCFLSKNNKILWYAEFFNIGW